MELEKIIIILGPPGSGKGTQSKLLGQNLNFAYFSTGALLRDYAKADDELGRKIKNFIDNGIIIPDDLMVEIFEKQLETVSSFKGVILDGYPRTLGQVKILEGIMERHNINQLAVLFLEVDKQKLLGRLTRRKTCKNCQAIYLPAASAYATNICSKCAGELTVRADDDPKVIEKRFEEYLIKTKPVKDYYDGKGLVTYINGDQLIEEVQKEILEKLKYEKIKF